MSVPTSHGSSSANRGGRSPIDLSQLDRALEFRAELSRALAEEQSSWTVELVEVGTETVVRVADTTENGSPDSARTATFRVSEGPLDLLVAEALARLQKWSTASPTASLAHVARPAVWCVAD
jgi:hypothetical protein